jgi:hypothetical protein
LGGFPPIIVNPASNRAILRLIWHLGCSFRTKDMNGITARTRPVWLPVFLALGTFLQPASGAETYVTHTNWIEKTITNVVEVRMPRNVFINEYQTNLVEQVHTNVVVIYSTNRITKELPQKVVVDVVHTNVIVHYSTNYINKAVPRTVAVDLVFTNFVDFYKTNVKIFRLTNDIAINLVQTNVVDQYRTNWQTLSFTNFETVLVMKTNWVTQPVTNVVRIDLPAPAAQAAPSRPTAAAKLERGVSRPSAATPTDGPVLEGAKTSSRSENNLVEVLLKVRWPADTADAPPVQQWKIEREDGAFMSFGQEQTFKKELPVGSYKIEARLQWESDAPVLMLRGTMVVTANEVVVHQKATGKKLASVGN